MTGLSPSSSPSIIRVIPNALSCLRLILAFIFPFAPQEWLLIIVVVGGATDFLDGFIARKFNARTRYGAFLDGVADKVFVNVVLISLCARGLFSWWWLAMLVSRDAVVVILAVMVAVISGWETLRTISARFLGKAATLGQFVFMFAAVGWRDGADAILGAAVAVSLVAAIDYVLAFAHGYRRVEGRGASSASTSR